MVPRHSISALVCVVLLAAPASAEVKVLTDAAITSIHPTSKSPANVSDADVDSIRRSWEALTKADPSDMGKHPLADDFPGSVPDNARRLSRTIVIDPSIRRWHSTGLYAPPGEVITVFFPESAVRTGIHLRIGAHQDQLWNKKPDDTWRRFPSVTLARPVNHAEMKLACPFGGLVYVEMPANAELSGQFTVSVSGVVEAPLFEIDKTPLPVWQDAIRAAPGPWAELAGKRVVFTVPSELVRAMDDPTELLKLWDAYLDACSDLTGRPRDRSHPERFVFDRQISAGWMHSGYPIMAHLESVGEVIDLDKVRQVPWGPLHELGHNHQQGAWTNGYNGEVSTNLFPLYVRWRFLNQRIGGHPELAKERMHARLADLFSLPRERRQPDLFQRLWMYDAISAEFGFEVWTRMWKHYDALPRDQWPKNDQDENTQALIRLSQFTGHNLAPYFQEWNYPADYSQLGEIEDLPAWNPQGFPGLFGDAQVQ